MEDILDILVEVNPNIVVNGDFRHDTVNGFPDGWNRYLAPKYMLDVWWETPCLEIVSESGLPEGCEKAAKLVVPTSSEINEVYIELEFAYFMSKLHLASRLNATGRFKLSFYAKADNDKSLKVDFFGDTYYFDLTSEWTRFTLTKDINHYTDLYDLQLQFTPQDTGTFYITGVQLKRDDGKVVSDRYTDSPFISRIKNLPKPQKRSDFRQYLLDEYGIDYDDIPEVSDPTPEGTVVVDPQKRCLLVNGSPYFYFGACFLRVHYAVDKWDQLLSAFANHGYTAIVATFATRSSTSSRATDEQVVQFFDLAASYGLKVVIWISPNAVEVNGKVYKVKGLPPEDQVPYFENEIQYFHNLVGDHSALLAYYLYDEPMPEVINAGALDEIISYAQSLNLDRPLEINYGNVWWHYEYLGHEVPVDIVCQTSYPVPRYSVQRTAEHIARNYIAGGYKRLVTAWHQFYGGIGRYPTPDEFTCMVYLAAIYGATGFQTWPSMPTAKPLWDRAKAVISEMKQLEDWLYQGERLSATIDNDFIDFALKQVGSDYILVTINFSNQTQDAVITLDDVPSISQVEDFFTGDPISFSGNTITTTYLPYERKVFRIIA